MGTGVALRAAVLELLELDAGIPVLITALTERMHSLNTTLLAALGSGGNLSTTDLNATVLGAALGDSTSRTSVAVDADDPLNVELPPGRPARRVMLTDGIVPTVAACERTELINATNITTSEVEMLVDLPPSLFVAEGALTQAARVAMLAALQARARVALRNVTTVSLALRTVLGLWENCTGVPPAAAVVASSVEVLVPSSSPSPSSPPPPAPPQYAAAVGAPPGELSLPALLVVGLAVLAAVLAALCLGCATRWRQRAPRAPPLPALHLTLADGRVVLLPLRLGFAAARDQAQAPTSEAPGAPLCRRRRGRPHQLLLVIPAGAPCREPLGLRNDSFNDDVGLPVAILAPAAGAGGSSSHGGEGGEQAEALHPVHWYADDDGGGSSADARSGRLAPLDRGGWVVACPGLAALEAPHGEAAPSAAAGRQQRAVVALRIATHAERQLLLGGGHSGLPAGGAATAHGPSRGAASVTAGAVLEPSELARRLRLAARDWGPSADDAT